MTLSANGNVIGAGQKMKMQQPTENIKTQQSNQIALLPLTKASLTMKSEKTKL